MGTEEEGFHQWFRQEGEICFRNETGGAPLFCGQEEDCYIGMALPFINESTWDWRLRAVLYLVGLLYRSVQRLECADMPMTRQSFLQKRWLIKFSYVSINTK